MSMSIQVISIGNGIWAERSGNNLARLFYAMLYSL